MDYSHRIPCKGTATAFSLVCCDYPHCYSPLGKKERLGTQHPGVPFLKSRPWFLLGQREFPQIAPSPLELSSLEHLGMQGQRLLARAS